MERDVGPQVASSIFLRHSLPGGCFHDAPSKKRDPQWEQSPSFCHPHQPYQNPPKLVHGHPNPDSNWNPNMWAWDSVEFTAKPSSDSRGSLTDVEQRKNGEEGFRDSIRGIEGDGENLSLKLGGGLYSVAEETVKRPSKRVRCGSPGSGGVSYPMCQVDECRADLSGAKDYHRRHKVCEIHSKINHALVGKLMQRFCQQCSRFHPLAEFDEGKRSCRRRLAGHNRRRRKTHPEDVSLLPSLPSNQANGSNGNMDIFNLLAILASLQGKNTGKPSNIQPLPDRDHLIQILSKINNFSTEKSSARSPVPCGFDLNVLQSSQPSPLNHSSKGNGNSTTPMVDLIAAVSAAIAASAPGTTTPLHQDRSNNSGDEKTNKPSLNHNNLTQILPSLGVGSSSQLQGPQLRSPLQLFGSEDDSPPKLGSSVKYLSSESSNPMEERSPPSSPPIAKEFFPVHSASERQYKRMSISREDNTTVEASTSSVWNKPFDLFKVSERRVEDGAVQNVRYQPGYASSGSDQSPCSSRSDAQDRTGRIMFKLFEKDPSNMPGTLRSQIHNWLSNSPSDMESYIRPGCVVLSIYISMPSTAWDELEDDLLHRVSSLVQCSDSDFWRNGRFLVHTSRQLASYKDGKTRISKSWRAWSTPWLTYVSPIAVVSGQETSLLLRGCNLTVPGTKIHCTYMGGYTSKEVLGSTYPGTVYDDSCSESFNFSGGTPHVLGRCFIEVENGFKGNSFPLIIADANIVQELRALESEFEENDVPDDQVQNNERPRLREDALHFLNELGWLFQKLTTPSTLPFTDLSISRFKFLFTFSVERDWPFIVKALLDTLVEKSLASEVLSNEALEMLSDVHLLNRAVKRKCKKMVDLLLRFSVRRGPDASEVYPFIPNMVGPGGVTPLHLAASTQDSMDIIDALTNDPQEIGLNCWNLVLDDSGQSPHTYAAFRNNHSYNELVARKLKDRRNSQVSITVQPEKPSISGKPGNPANRPTRRDSCARCAKIGIGRVGHATRTHGLLQRPFVLSMLAIAAVCVCVCLCFRGMPKVGSFATFKWENMDFGPS